MFSGDKTTRDSENKIEIKEIFKTQNIFLKYEDFNINEINLKNYLNNLINNWDKIFDIFYLNLNNISTLVIMRILKLMKVEK